MCIELGKYKGKNIKITTKKYSFIHIIIKYIIYLREKNRYSFTYKIYLYKYQKKSYMLRPATKEPFIISVFFCLGNDCKRRKLGRYEKHAFTYAFK